METVVSCVALWCTCMAGQTDKGLLTNLFESIVGIRKSPYCQISELHGPVGMFLNDANTPLNGAGCFRKRISVEI